SEFEDLPPVILERKLNAIIIDVKAVAEVNPPAKHKLAPNRDARNGVVYQIRECIVTLMEVRWLLRVGVLDVQHGIADRGTKGVTPVVIEERDHAQQRQRYSFDRCYRIRQIVLDADIDWGVVHIVLNAFAVDNLEFPGVLLAKLQAGSQVQTPTKSITAEVTCWGPVEVDPTDL